MRENGVNRVSLGAQSFQPRLLEVLERVAGPDDVRRAVYLLRDAGFDNISLDLIYGIPGQSPAELASDLAEALALEPEHISAYELEAKPGTRFTHAHGAELERQAESMESYFELVVETLTRAGYRWYETANFCRAVSSSRREAWSVSLRARHNLGYWLGHDYLGLGVGAVSTIENRRWRNAPSLRGYVDALAAGRRPPRELEELRRRCARPSASCSGCGSTSRSSVAAAERDARSGRARAARAARAREPAGRHRVADPRAGRFLGDGVTARAARLRARLGSTPRRPRLARDPRSCSPTMRN